MKKALMVTNPFLPAVNAGVRRTVGFVRQLRNYGWEPVVLTREVSAADRPEDGADTEIPEGVDIYRTYPWELDELPGILGKMGSRLGNWLLMPDKQRLWEIFSRRKAARIVKYEGIDLIYTASAPKSSHLLGLYLKKKYSQLPWIADIRAANAKGNGAEQVRTGGIRAGVERKTDRLIYTKADCIVTDSEGIRKAILENSRVPGIDERLFVIPDGFAEELSGVFEKACRQLASKRLIGE